MLITFQVFEHPVDSRISMVKKRKMAGSNMAFASQYPCSSTIRFGSKGFFLLHIIQKLVFEFHRKSDSSREIIIFFKMHREFHFILYAMLNFSLLDTISRNQHLYCPTTTKRLQLPQRFSLTWKNTFEFQSTTNGCRADCLYTVSIQCQSDNR